MCYLYWINTSIGLHGRALFMGGGEQTHSGKMPCYSVTNLQWLHVLRPSDLLSLSKILCHGIILRPGYFQCPAVAPDPAHHLA